MEIVFYILGVLICLVLGFASLQRLGSGRIGPILHILLALALGLGRVGILTFYIRILFNQSNRFFPLGLTVLTILISYGFLRSFLGKKSRIFDDCLVSLHAVKSCLNKNTVCGLAALGVLSVPLAISAHYYPLGGWDAWSCWSLKAKFLFTAQDNWKDMFLPDLWRSNTHYPLLWPLINVWFADIAGRFDQTSVAFNFPMLNSLLITLLTAGILLFGLLELTGRLWVSIAASVIVAALPFDITLFTSQYSDSLLGLFLLSAFTCMLLADKYGLPQLKLLSLVFLGMMAFTKNEGLAGALVVGSLLLWQKRSNKKELINMALVFVLALLPIFIFIFFIAPKNQAFINGLTSMDKPTNWPRLVIIAVYPWMEFISAKWNGFWLLVLGGIILGGKKLWQSTSGLIGLSVILYLGVVMAYYGVNTFFEIGWWLSTTLSRILFALLPSITLWLACSFYNSGWKPAS